MPHTIACTLVKSGGLSAQQRHISMCWTVSLYVNCQTTCQVHNEHEQDKCQEISIGSVLCLHLSLAEFSILIDNAGVGAFVAVQKIAIQDKRALAKQFSRTHQDFDYSEDKPEEASSSLKRDTVLSRFMPTSRRLVQFSDGNVADPHAKIVYIDGAFDLFHVGHIEILKVNTSCPSAFCPLNLPSDNAH